MTPSLKGKWLFNRALVYLNKKKSDYTLATFIPSLCLLARIGYYWLRGGGDREAKPPLLHILTTLRLHYMVKLTLFIKIGIIHRQEIWALNFLILKFFLFGIIIYNFLYTLFQFNTIFNLNRFCLFNFVSKRIYFITSIINYIFMINYFFSTGFFWN